MYRAIWFLKQNTQSHTDTQAHLQFYLLIIITTIKEKSIKKEEKKIKILPELNPIECAHNLNPFPSLFSSLFFPQTRKKSRNKVIKEALSTKNKIK